jgi:hypothetical protein
MHVPVKQERVLAEEKIMAGMRARVGWFLFEEQRQHGTRFLEATQRSERCNGRREGKVGGVREPRGFASEEFGAFEFLKGKVRHRTGMMEGPQMRIAWAEFGRVFK